jgi:hypothetical protein
MNRPIDCKLAEMYVKENLSKMRWHKYGCELRGDSWGGPEQSPTFES